MSSIRPDTIYLNEVSQTHLIAPCLLYTSESNFGNQFFGRTKDIAALKSYPLVFGKEERQRVSTVSYTHLDVYKRQGVTFELFTAYDERQPLIHFILVLVQEMFTPSEMCIRDRISG